MLSTKRSILLVGTAGTTVIAAASWWDGGLPAGFRRHRPEVLRWLPSHSGYAVFASFVGLGVLLAAWLALGRLVYRAEEPLRLRALMAAWATPMLASMPMGRDLWLYIAHGRMVQVGLDPYKDTPAMLAHNYEWQVNVRWMHIPSPYGPIWIQLSRLAGNITDPHVPHSIFLIRLPIYAAYLLLGWLIYQMAPHLGFRADRAAWLALANPIAVVLTLGGHNDLVLVALMLAGIAYAVHRPGSWLALAGGGALIGLAVMVKFPGLIALAFVVPIWLAVRGGHRTVRDIATACAVAFGAAVVTGGIVTAVCGLGVGWVRAANADNSIVNWQTVPTLAGMLVNTVTLGASHATVLNDTVRLCRSVGSALSAVLVLAFWVLALRRRSAKEGIALLGLAFLAVIELGQTFQPWYLCWILPLFAIAVTSRRWIGVLVAASVFEILVTLPDGRGYEDRLAAIPALLVAALMAQWVTQWVSPAASRPASGSAAPDGDADDAGPGVRADRRADLRGEHLPH